MRACLVALALLGCRERYHATIEAHDAARTVSDVARVDASAPADAAEEIAGVVIARSSGAVATDATLRAVDAGVTSSGLFAGDQVSTGADGEVTLALDVERSVTLGAEGVLEVPGYAGASLVLSRGTAELAAAMGARDPVRVDTPAGRVIVSNGRALVVVADDGSVRVSALEGAVTAWPSPPPPPRRSTSLSPAERRRLALASPGHPVLLDVDLPELAANEVRAAAPRAIDPGASLAWNPSGELFSSPIARVSPASIRGQAARWLTTRNALARRADAHLVAVDALSRAGAGDVADLRAAVARLRTNHETTERARTELFARASLAVGRLTARARRGRSLAARGGNVTALVQLASLEELREALSGFRP